MTAEGEDLIRWSWRATGLLTVAAAAGVVAPDDLGLVTALVSIALFLVGCGVFLRAYWLALQRSRHEAIGIGGLYFLAGSAPVGVRRSLLGSLAVQVAVALAAAAARPFTSVAFVVLAPMLGLALAGLWAARHGTFPPRPDREP